MRKEFKKWEEERKSILAAERIAALNNLGFDWAVEEAGEIRLQTSRNLSEELERHEDQPTPQNHQQPQHSPPTCQRVLLHPYIKELDDGSYLI